jgi:hypothetical protein
MGVKKIRRTNNLFVVKRTISIHRLAQNYNLAAMHPEKVAELQVADWLAERWAVKRWGVKNSANKPSFTPPLFLPASSLSDLGAEDF